MIVAAIVNILLLSELINCITCVKLLPGFVNIVVRQSTAHRRHILRLGVVAAGKYHTFI